MADKFYYKIGEACKTLDIQPYVLRYWETEFKALSPSKSKSGQRVYNERDLQLIQRIKELLYDEGYTIAGAKKKLEAEQASGRKLKPVAKAKPKPAPKQKESKPAAPKAEPKKVEAKAEPEKKEPAPKVEPKKAAPARKAPARKAARPAPTDAEAAAKARLSKMTRAVRKALAEAKELQKYLDSSG